MKKSLSIIIVTYNSEDVILPCIDSITASLVESNSNAEIIIIDNASIDHTVGIVAGKYPAARYNVNTKNRGFAAAVNQGIALAGGEYIFLLNPDTVLERSFFTVLNNHLETLWRPAVIGCRMMAMDGSRQLSTWKNPTLLTLLMEMFLPYNTSLILVTEHPESTGEVATVSGGAMIFNKEIATAIGGFDENYFMYIEDLDFCLRAKKAGYSISFLNNASVRHVGGKSSWVNPGAFFTNYYSSKLWFFRKHCSTASFVFAILLIDLGCVIRIVVYGVAGIMKKNLWRLSSAHIHALPKIFRYGNSLLRN